MPPFVYQDLSIDVVDVDTALPFWAATLGLDPVPDDRNARLVGPTRGHTVWITAVPEPKTVKNRVHLDVHAGDLADLERLGARRLADLERWTLFAAPDGQEFCAFVRDEPPALRLYEIAVDCAAAQAQARWWGAMFGTEPHVESDAEEEPYWWVDVPGAPFETLTFQPVPEPKTVKNRVHWDVRADSTAAALNAGATLLRAKGDGVRWHVLADPEGNEFCIFDD